MSNDPSTIQARQAESDAQGRKVEALARRHHVETLTAELSTLTSEVTFSAAAGTWVRRPTAPGRSA